MGRYGGGVFTTLPENKSGEWRSGPSQYSWKVWNNNDERDYEAYL